MVIQLVDGDVPFKELVRYSDPAHFMANFSCGLLATSFGLDLWPKASFVPVFSRSEKGQALSCSFLKRFAFYIGY